MKILLIIILLVLLLTSSAVVNAFFGFGPTRGGVPKGKDLYKTLGLTRKATQKEVNKAFRQLSKEWHPDSSKHENAKEVYADILKAKAILGDPEKRKTYDQFGIIEGENGIPSAEERRRQGGSGTGADFDPFAQFFNAFAGRGGGGGDAPFHHNYQRRPEEKPNLQFKTTPDLNVERFAKLKEFRGPRLFVVFVYSDYNQESRAYADTWNKIASGSSGNWRGSNGIDLSVFKKLATFLKINVDENKIVLDMADVGLDQYYQLPFIFLMRDGKATVLDYDCIQITPSSPSHMTDILSMCLMDYVNDLMTAANDVVTVQNIQQYLPSSSSTSTKHLTTTSQVQEFLQNNFYNTVLLIDAAHPQINSVPCVAALRAQFADLVIGFVNNNQRLFGDGEKCNFKQDVAWLYRKNVRDLHSLTTTKVNPCQPSKRIPFQSSFTHITLVNDLMTEFGFRHYSDQDVSSDIAVEARVLLRPSVALASRGNPFRLLTPNNIHSIFEKIDRDLSVLAESNSGTEYSNNNFFSTPPPPNDDELPKDPNNYQSDLFGDNIKARQQQKQQEVEKNSFNNNNEKSTLVLIQLVSSRTTITSSVAKSKYITSYKLPSDAKEKQQHINHERTLNSDEHLFFLDIDEKETKIKSVLKKEMGVSSDEELRKKIMRGDDDSVATLLVAQTTIQTSTGRIYYTLYLLPEISLQHDFDLASVNFVSSNKKNAAVKKLFDSRDHTQAEKLFAGYFRPGEEDDTGEAESAEDENKIFKSEVYTKTRALPYSNTDYFKHLVFAQPHGDVYPPESTVQYLVRWAFWIMRRLFSVGSIFLLILAYVLKLYILPFVWRIITWIFGRRNNHNNQNQNQEGRAVPSNPLQQDQLSVFKFQKFDELELKVPSNRKLFIVALATSVEGVNKTFDKIPSSEDDLIGNVSTVSKLPEIQLRGLNISAPSNKSLAEFFTSKIPYLDSHDEYYRTSKQSGSVVFVALKINSNNKTIKGTILKKGRTLGMFVERLLDGSEIMNISF